MSASPADYAHLTPDEVLSALDAVGLRGDGRILQLNSYENRVFQVMLEDGSAIVAKFYRPGRWSEAQILEEHAFAQELLDAEVPVVAPLALVSGVPGVVCLPASGPATLALRSTAQGTLRYAAAPRRAGRAPELEDDAVLRRLGSFIGRLHAVGAQQSFEHRRTLRPAQDVQEGLDLLRDGGHVPEDQQRAWEAVAGQALEQIAAAFSAVRPRQLRLHGDCHPGNLLWRDNGVNAVDLDDACNGPAIQDLWMLLSGEPAAAAHQLGQLLAGYGAFMRFDRRELQLIDALRLLRMIRHNAWVAQRWTDPAFPVAFPDFGTSAYWGQQVTQLREQLRALNEPPRWDEVP